MTREPSPQARYASYAILALGAGSYLLQNFVWFSFPALLPEILGEVSLTSTEAGVLNGIIPFVYIFLAIAVGAAVDRIGGRWGIGLSLLLFGGGQMLRGFAWDFPSFLATTVVIAVGAAGISMGLPKIVASYFRPERSGAMSSGYVLGAQVGSALVFLLARPYLSPLLGGWRTVFLWSGAVVVAAAVVWLPVVTWLDAVFERGVPGGHPAADDGVADGGAEDGGAGDGGVEDGGAGDAGSAAGDGASDDDPAAVDDPEPGLRHDLRMLVANRQLRLLVVIGTMLLALSHGLRGWLPVVLESDGLDAGLAATVVSVLVVGQIVGVLTIPPLSDRLGKRRFVLVCCGLLAAAGPVGLLLLPTVAGKTVGVFCTGLGLGGVSPLVRALPIELPAVGPRLTATAVGLIFTVGEVGGFLAPFLIGFLRDASGSFVPGIALLAAAGLVMAVAGSLMAEPT